MKKQSYFIILAVLTTHSCICTTVPKINTQLTETQKACILAAIRHLTDVTQQKIRTTHFSNEVTAHDLSIELSDNTIDSGKDYTHLCNTSNTLLAIIQKITPLDHYSLTTKDQLQALLKQLHNLTKSL